MGIETLDGLEYMANSPYSDDIAWINFSGSDISDASVLSGFHNVTVLDLSRNNLSDVDFLASMPKLQELRISQNQIMNAEGLTKSAPPDLWQLWLNDNQITNISALASLSGLQDLNLSGNQIGDVEPLAGQRQLISLDLSFNNIDDVDAFASSSMENLSELNMTGNEVHDVAGLAALTSLQVLDLGENRIGDDSNLSSLGSIHGLERLDLYYNEISDATPVGDLIRSATGLWSINLSANKIENISALLPFMQWMSKAWPTGIDDSWKVSRPDLCEQERCLSLVLDGNRIVDVSGLPSGFRYSEELELGISLMTQNVSEQSSVGTTIALPMVRTASTEDNVTWTVIDGPAKINDDGTVTYTGEGIVLLGWENPGVHAGTNNDGVIATVPDFSGCVVVSVSGSTTPGSSSTTGGSLNSEAPWATIAPIALGVLLLVGVVHKARRRLGGLQLR